MVNVNSNGPLNKNYMKRIKDTLNKSLNEHHRTMVLRIDLRLPDDSPYEKEPELILVLSNRSNPKRMLTN